MADFLYLAAHKNYAMHGSASATVDTDYNDDWLNDGRPGRPARGTSGTLSATITNASTGTVNLVAIVNHNLNANVTLGGGLSGTITASATQQDGIPLNVFASITPASVGSFTIAATNSGTWVIGEVMAGEATTLTLPHYRSDRVRHTDNARPVEMDLSSIPGYDPGLGRPRVWEMSWPALTTSELDGLLAAFDAQKNKTKPTLVVRRTSVNDALCGWITEIEEEPSEVPGRVQVSLSFEEIPRVRW